MMVGVPKKVDSVYDFLYADAQRIAVFLAQLNDHGHLTGLTRTRSSGSTAGGGLSIPIAKLDSSESETSTLQRQYDPQWLAPLQFLDHTKDMLVRDLASARIGQMVLVSGELALFDMGLLEKAWSLPAVKKMIFTTMGQETKEVLEAGNRHDRRKAGRLPKSGEVPSENAAGFEMMTVMPHAIQATIRSQSLTAWTILKASGLTTPANELLLKHGVSVPGTWNMVGVVDARPEEETEAEGALQQLVAALSLGGLAGMIAGSFAPAVRTTLGRPMDSFGIAPVMIFREVSG